MFLSLVMDAVVAILLVATIIFALRLNRRLAALRDDSKHLAELVRGLQTASDRAEVAVAGLRSTASHAGRELQETIDKATALRNDINFLSERGQVLLDRLEAGLKLQRDVQAATGGTRVPPAASAGRASSAAAPPARARVEERAREETPERGQQSRLAMLLKQAETDRREDSQTRSRAPEGRSESRSESRAETRRDAKSEPRRREPQAPHREEPRLESGRGHSRVSVRDDSLREELARSELLRSSSRGEPSRSDSGRIDQSRSDQSRSDRPLSDRMGSDYPLRIEEDDGDEPQQSRAEREFLRALEARNRR